MAEEQQSLESAATLTLGSFSHGALEDIGGMEVQQCSWLVFVDNFSRDNSVKPCTKIAGFLGKQRLGCLGGRAHEKLRSTRLETSN